MSILSNDPMKFLRKYTSIILTQNILEKIIPRELKTLEDIHFFTNDSPLHYDIESVNLGLCNPIWNMLDRSGKMWRGSLCLMAAEALGLKCDQLSPLAAVIELIHNGSLICDDVEDNSEYRRGKECTHKLFGVNTAINAGNFMYFLPMRTINALPIEDSIKLRLHSVCTDEYIHLHLGQCSDIFWNNDKKLPTEDEYYKMISNKTAALAKLSVKFALEYSKASPVISNSLIEYSKCIGTGFQIVDDILNLESEEYAKGRSFLGEDISEGKKTLIVIRAAQQLGQEKERLLEIVNMKTNDVDKVNEALDIIRSTDAIEYSRRKSMEMQQEAIDHLEVFNSNNEGVIALRELAGFITNRSK